MKYLIGFICIAFVLFIATYFLLKVWGIELLAAENLNKTLVTLSIVAATSLILIVIIPFFLKNNASKYDQQNSGVAQKKI